MISTSDWDALQRSISGVVVLPGTDAYEQARPPFVAGFRDPRPEAVVRCAAAEDVAEVIGFARRHRIHTAIRSGGHSFAGYSTTTGIVMDVTPMSAVVVADGVAKVGAGTRLGELYETLLADGVTVPSGTCPSVGIGGITLGGGHGVLGRAYGLTLDHLLAAEVVLADGRLVECDDHHHPDLFWALRGAGSGNFGVVTSFIFRPRPAPRMTNFGLVWSYRHAAALIAAWQRWVPYAADGLTADVTVGVTDERAVEVAGAHLGTEQDTSRRLDTLVASVGADPASSFCRDMSYLDTVRFQAGVGGTVPGRSVRFTKSEFFDRPLPGRAIAALVGTFAMPRGPGQSRTLEFAPWGGAYNRRPADGTAFVHRDQLFLLEHLVHLPPEAPAEDRRAAHEWVRQSWAAVHPWASGHVYPNFPDPELQDWGQAYYGKNHARLLKVKQTYDPENLFATQQPLRAR
jgi:FAD/FMN-containing dehydrogenase